MAATTEILKLMYAFPVKRHLPGRAGLLLKFKDPSLLLSTGANLLKADSAGDQVWLLPKGLPDPEECCFGAPEHCLIIWRCDLSLLEVMMWDSVL